MTDRELRVVLYSHDTMGLGHMRRNLLLAETLAAAPSRPAVLLITGSRESSRFAVPRGVDCLSLPALYKDSSAAYQSRTLGVTLREIIQLRSTAILGAVDAFRPHVVIADNVPRGAVGELDPTLSYLRRRHRRTRVVLGLRDILDEPAQVRKEWTRAANFDVIRRCYDAIWVYGDRDVNDVAGEYGFPDDVAAKVSYTGYLDQRCRSSSRSTELEAQAASVARSAERVVLCTVGGGQDGARLAESFAAAPFAPDVTPVLVTGPQMSADARARLRAAGRASRLEVLEFVEEPAHLLRRADAVVSMGGYNSVCDLLSYRKRALVVPRVVPRTEQLIRAERLAARGLVDVMHPDALSPEGLARWAAAPATPARHTVRFHTPDRIWELFDALQTPQRPAAWVAGEEVRRAS